MTSGFPSPILLLLCFAFLFALLEFIGPYVFNYRIQPDRIRFVVLGLIPIGHIKLCDIADVRKVSWYDSLSHAFSLTNLSLHNRLFGQWLLITKPKGLFKSVLVTPANADEFIETVMRYRLALTLPDHIMAHSHCIQNYDEILASGQCGCFYCAAVFPSSAVANWVKDKEGQTAICPKCGMDAVLGDRSGYRITEELLRRMHQYWL